MGDRLCDFLRHDAILLLHYSFSIPRFIFLLRTAPVFLFSQLRDYDVLCSLLSSLLNIPLEYDSPSWAQASLPVRCDGLGFRSVVQLATSCFLSAAAASQEIVQTILPERLHSSPLLYRNEALACWSQGLSDPALPDTENECHQRAWDFPRPFYTELSAPMLRTA